MRETRNPYSDIVNIMMNVSGKTKVELAEHLGINYNTFVSMSRLRNGKCRTFDISEIIKMAEFCGFDLILEKQGVKINLIEYIQNRKEDEECSQ